jgi:hypothetical protein
MEWAEKDAGWENGKQETKKWRTKKNCVNMVANYGVSDYIGTNAKIKRTKG